MEEYSCRFNSIFIQRFLDYLQVIPVIAGSLISGFVLRKFGKMHFSYFKYNWTYSGHPGIDKVVTQLELQLTISNVLEQLDHVSYHMRFFTGFPQTKNLSKSKIAMKIVRLAFFLCQEPGT